MLLIQEKYLKSTDIPASQKKYSTSSRKLFEQIFFLCFKKLTDLKFHFFMIKL